jgi:hypothetical protein
MGVYWFLTAFVSGVLDETDDHYLSVENGRDRVPYRETRWRDSSEVYDRSVKVGIAERNQAQVL